jgi:hypothetical protein
MRHQAHGLDRVDHTAESATVCIGLVEMMQPLG